MKFRKKPVEIEAEQFDGTRDNVLKIIEGLDAIQATWYYDEDKQTLDIATLEGKMTASKGDWIIKGVKGEFYPCKPDIFELTYEPVIVGKEWTNGAHPIVRAKFVPPIDFQVDPADLYCVGCGKPKVLCLHDTTGCL